MLKDILGLRQRIASAASDDEINNLLAEGAKFEVASSRTRRSWRLTAERRKAELARNAEGTSKAHIKTRIDHGNGKAV